MPGKKETQSSTSGSFSKKEAISFGFNVAKKNFFYYISVFVIIVFINAFLNIFQGVLAIQNQLGLSFVLAIVKIIFSVVVGMGFIKIALEFVDGQKPKIQDLFYTKSMVSYFLAILVTGILTGAAALILIVPAIVLAALILSHLFNILSGLIVIVIFVLCLIPVIILSIKLQFATYLIVDKNLGVPEALSKSWNMTKGVKLNLFLFAIILLLVNLLGILVLLVGLLVTIPLSMVALAYVYRRILSLSS